MRQLKDSTIPRVEEIIDSWDEKVELDEAPRRQGAPKMTLNKDLADDMKDFIWRLDNKADVLVRVSSTSEYGKMIKRLANKLRDIRWEYIF